MSFETTLYIPRKQAEAMAIEALATKIAAISSMDDMELEEFVYILTRESHYFDNFKIKETSSS